MVTLDTSALLVAANRGDPDHSRVVSAMRDDRGPLVIPMGILAEVTYFLREDFGSRLLNAFLDDLLVGRYLLDCGEEDLPRIQELVQRYDDFPLGFADAAVIACAERHGGKVLTLDLRHFGVVAREGTITILP
ncbi:MAG: type II toxin-antitoxin system VapC family toxin [Thermomicrobiales bacterium]